MKVVHAPDTEWNSATAPEEGAIVNVLAKDNLGQYSIPFPVFFEMIAGGTQAAAKS